jgi:hypothetical protein
VFPLAVAAIVTADVGFKAEPTFPVQLSEVPQPLASALVIEDRFDRRYEYPPKKSKRGVDCPRAPEDSKAKTAMQRMRLGKLIPPPRNARSHQNLLLGTNAMVVQQRHGQFNIRVRRRQRTKVDEICGVNGTKT